MRRMLTLFITSTLIFAITACNTQGPADLAGKEPAASEENNNVTEADQEAAAIFKKQCISCHGTDLSGRTGEQSNLQKVGARLSKEQIMNTIKNGGQMMPAQKNLSDVEIQILADWLSTKK